MNAEQSSQTVDAALARATARLRPAPAAALDAQLLLGHTLARGRGELLAHTHELIAPRQLADFERAIERRARGEPLAYITGRKEFWSLTLQVSPAVLVPRPETELVVERCLALLVATAARVADLGTGSGAIALALARERPLWQVTATDQSLPALGVAAANARSLALDNVCFLAGDWYGALSGERLDLIASNPPYIGANDRALDDPALRHEPPAALCSGPTGLEALAELIAGAGALAGRGGLAGAGARRHPGRGGRGFACRAGVPSRTLPR